MGAPMARRLLGAGFPLTVWNRTASRCEALVESGAAVAASPRALAERAQVVVTMVSDAVALEEVLDGDEGLLAGMGPGSILVDMSTIGPAAAHAFAGRVTERGGSWIDAPVSGSTALAEQGALTTMVGGNPEAIERVRPILEAMTQKIFVLGAEGTGAAMKLAVNAVIAALNEAIAEGLVLAERSGIARATAYDVFAGGVAAAPYVLYKRDAFVSPEQTPVAFTVELMRKDLRLVFALADELGLPLAAVRAADDVLARAEERELGDADFSRVAQVIRDA
jgi:3-hydroxyisobutyrate dehydrogenase-like beta-hydroxyacid dehydrogenase